MIVLSRRIYKGSRPYMSHSDKKEVIRDNDLHTSAALTPPLRAFNLLKT